jgi:hypothetical protein
MSTRVCLGEGGCRRTGRSEDQLKFGCAKIWRVALSSSEIGSMEGDLLKASRQSVVLSKMTLALRCLNLYE